MKHLAATIILVLVMLSITVAQHAQAPEGMQSICTESVCSIVAIP